MQQEPNKLVNTDDARQKALVGVEIAYKAVSSTFGPRSRNVAIKRPFGAPAVIHDGVNVFRSIFPLENKEAEIGAEIAFEAASKTNDTAGDGTTLATILIRENVVAAHKYITAGARPMALREGMELATHMLLDELDKLVTKIDVEKDADKLLMVATISAQVPDIGQMVADAYKALGKDGILTVEESKTTESQLELKQGMQFDEGWISPYFVTPGSKHEEAFVENPYILVVDFNLRDLEEFNEMLLRLVQDGVKNIVVIADRIEVPVAAYFLKNHIKGAISGLMVTAPSFGEKRVDMLRDIAIATGGELVSEAAGMGLQSVDKSHLGRARRVVSTRDTTLIVDGEGDKERIEIRIKELKEKVKSSDLSAFDREKIKERLARLHAGVGVLTIGANSEPEMKERKERAIDAISAAKAALAEGIVPGGGVAIRTAAAAVRKALEGDKRLDEFDVRSGVNIILEACEKPYKKLLSNAGYDPGYYQAKLEDKPVGFGVDVMDGKIVDMVTAGIIDPVMVIKAAVAHSSSAAVSLSTSETLITPIMSLTELEARKGN